MPAFFKALNTLLLLAILVALALAITHIQSVEDWYKLRGYSPPANIAALAGDDAMTAYATRIFYVNHPVLESNVAAFRAACNETEQTIVLGCYHGNQNGIEIYNVTDSRLSGVQQVTAAHEMLHSAYDRLSSAEKSSVDTMLQAYYQHDLHDQRIIDTIRAYQKSEPNDVVNEMHSVFGTEVASLPSPLEQYYSRYFNNRAKITAYAANYEDEFTSRTSQIDTDDQQLAVLKTQINAEEQNLQSQLSSLQAGRTRVENSDSEAEINTYNAQVEAYNSGVKQLQADISAYNNLVASRNAIAADLATLDAAIDTRLTAQATQ